MTQVPGQLNEDQAIKAFCVAAVDQFGYTTPATPEQHAAATTRAAEILRQFIQDGHVSA